MCLCSHKQSYLWPDEIRSSVWKVGPESGPTGHYSSVLEFVSTVVRIYSSSFYLRTGSQALSIVSTMSLLIRQLTAVISPDFREALTVESAALVFLLK